MTKEEIKLIQSLDRQTCLYAHIYSQRMTFSAPTFDTIIFDKNFIIKDDKEFSSKSIINNDKKYSYGYSSDFGMQVKVQEFDNQIIITVTDGDSEPTNKIYIFQR